MRVYLLGGPVESFSPRDVLFYASMEDGQVRPVDVERAKANQLWIGFQPPRSRIVHVYRNFFIFPDASGALFYYTGDQPPTDFQ